MKKLIGGWVLGLLILNHSMLFAQETGKEITDRLAKLEERVSSIDIHGFVDTYYSYNFNKPDSDQNFVGPGPSNFDFYHNSFSLALAEIVISKSASESSPVGFRVDLNFGATTDFVHCGVLNCTPSAAIDVTDPTAPTATVTSSSEEPYKNIQQAYVTWASPIGLTFDMGKFVTHMGLEVIESKDNWNYTRGLLFCCAIPYYHTGVRVNYAISDILFVNGYVYNGWNNVIETNGKKTFGAQIGFTPIKQVPIILNWIGPEDGIVFGNEVQVYDAIATFNISDTLAFAVNYDYGTSKSAATGDDMTWTGIAGYARLTMGNSALAARYEFVDDGDGAMFNAPNNKVQEVTLTAETKVAGSLLLRLEYRHDMSDVDIFTEEGGLATDTQDRVVAGVVYSF